MGGEIRVESEPGKGSAFHFSAQFKPDAGIDSGLIQLIAACPPAGLRILVADDNPVGRLLVTRLLESRKHSVTTVSTGVESVEQFKMGEFDIILMDVEMPGMDGFEATAAIRATGERGRRVPILAFTAHAMKEYEERCLRAGMNGHVSKPVQIAELMAAIAAAVTTGSATKTNEAGICADVRDVLAKV
jgi:CheY-like chemotaxis protein